MTEQPDETDIEPMETEFIEAAQEEGQVAPLDEELVVEREKHRQRAEKFGVDFKEPGQRHDMRHVLRKEKAFERAEARPAGFTPGFDIYSEEEIARRRGRAERFQISDVLQSYQPAVDVKEAARRKQRAEKFGTEYVPENAASLMEVDLLEQKREVDASEVRRLEAVHLYGVDLMNTKEVLMYFTEFSPVFVEWLDDSSCNVLFGDEYTAKHAIFTIGKPLPPEDIPEGQELSMDVTQLEKLWHKGPDFVKSGSSIPLIFRVATVADKRLTAGTHTTRRLWQATPQGGQKQRTGRQRHSTQRQQQSQLRDSRNGTVRRQGGGQTQTSRGPAGLDRALGSGHRKRKGDDVEMVDAQEGSVNDSSSFLAADAEREMDQDSVQERRQDLRRQKPKVTGLFSAAAAGILLPKRPSRLAKAELSHMASDGDAMAAAAAVPPSRKTVSYADL